MTPKCIRLGIGCTVAFLRNFDTFTFTHLAVKFNEALYNKNIYSKNAEKVYLLKLTHVRS